MTLVSNNYYSEFVPLKTDLEAVAVRVYFPIKFTVCNVYLRGSDRLKASDLDNIAKQLESPYMLLGHVNAHSLCWGSNHTDARGRIIEEFVSRHDLVILNKGNNTHVSYSYRSLSAIDVTMCTPMLQTFFDWYVEDDPHNSDHFPIIIPTISQYMNSTIREKWQVKRADWNKYQICLDFSDLNDNSPIDSHVSSIVSTINNAAKISIPKSSSHLMKKCVPWWNSEIYTSIKEKKKLFRTFRRTSDLNDLKNYLLATK
jgi:hypothetical protein